MAVEHTVGDSFDIHPDIVEILEQMREMRLQWIADEVERRIHEGTAESSSFEFETARRKKRQKTFEAVRGMTPDEQTAVLLQAIRDYLLLPPTLWNDARTNLFAILNDDQSRHTVEAIELVPPGEDVISVSVTDTESERIIDNAWTNLASDFEQLGLTGSDRQWTLS